MNTICRPPALKPGEKIGVMAPGCFARKEQTESARLLLEEMGYEVYIHPQSFYRDRQSAGTPQQKAEALHDLLLDDSVSAIIFARGGNRTLHFLPYIDMDIVRHNPKIMMGFSDGTALLNAVYAQTGQCGIHGPTLCWRWDAPPEELSSFWNIAVNMLTGQTHSLFSETSHTLRNGQAEGTLIGGNLSLMMHLLETPWCPSLEGAILYLEDVGDELSWIDRDLWYLKETKVLHKISALVLGGFSLKDTGKEPFGFTLEDIVRDHVRGLDIPVVYNAPFGHVKTAHCLPLGTPARLDAFAHASPKLTFLPPVSV